MTAIHASAGARFVRYSPQVNIVYEGNSLMAGLGATGGQTLPVQMANAAPLTGAGTVSTNLAVSGSTWSDMTTRAGGVDAAWAAGKTNILVLWEHLNSICAGGLTAAQSASAMATYIAARRAVHPWIVVSLTMLPCEGYSGVMTNQTLRDQYNSIMTACDNLIRANPTAYGVDALVDVRQAGSVFAIPAYLPANFDATGAIWNEAAGSRVHLNNAGYGLVAPMVNAVLTKLRRRPH